MRKPKLISWLKSDFHWLLPLLLAGCVGVGTWFYYAYIHSPTDFPPSLFVNGAWYMHNGSTLAEPPEALRYLGELNRLSPPHHCPSQDFETNVDSLMGAPVYQSGALVVVHGPTWEGEERWWLFALPKAPGL